MRLSENVIEQINEREGETTTLLMCQKRPDTVVEFIVKVKST
jgi:hypothetical protein